MGRCVQLLHSVQRYIRCSFQNSSACGNAPRGEKRHASYLSSFEWETSSLHATRISGQILSAYMWKEGAQEKALIRSWLLLGGPCLPCQGHPVTPSGVSGTVRQPRVDDGQRWPCRHPYSAVTTDVRSCDRELCLVEQRAQMAALACEAPAKTGRPISQWTGREIADELKQRAIVSQNSPRHAARLLKKGASNPTGFGIG